MLLDSYFSTACWKFAMLFEHKLQSWLHKKRMPKMSRYSLELDDKLVAQISHQQAKFLIDKMPGEWAPYTAKLSGKLVTAFRFLEDRWYRPAGTQQYPPVTIYIRKGAYLYPDKDESPV